jgi:hypothetical protein
LFQLIGISCIQVDRVFPELLQFLQVSIVFRFSLVGIGLVFELLFGGRGISWE